MAVPRIGLITIGQSPRDDIVPDMISQLGREVTVLQRGALDGLTLDDAQRLAPNGDEPWSVSRMQDGTEVRLAKRELVPRMQQRIDELQRTGVDLIVPLCASDWSSLHCPVPFINPGKALIPIVQAMLRPGGTLGVIAPTEAQAQQSHRRFADGLPLVSTFSQPYVESDAERHRQSEAAGRLLTNADAALIYMSCMGHTQEMRATVRKASDRPTITANGIIAGLMAQMIA